VWRDGSLIAGEKQDGDTPVTAEMASAFLRAIAAGYC
jgi:hypothetical protein